MTTRLNTDVSMTPFFDDFDERKDYYKIMFRPSVAIQTRELNQIQSILQEQIARFGDNIFKEGTIIKGVNFTFDDDYNYIKIMDDQVSGTPIEMTLLDKSIVKATSNLTAYVQSVAIGIESQNPDLNTLFIKYVNAGNGGEKTFTPGQVLTAYANNYSLQSIDVVNGGTGYANTDRVVFSASPGVGANATIITNNSGVIIGVDVNQGGTGYTSVPVCSIVSANGSSSNGTGASLTANNRLAVFSVAPNTFNVVGNTVFNTVGSGYSMTVTDGLIYQKGHFLRVEPQTVVVSKYTNFPDGLSVGFNTEELIVNNNIDVSLNDNALGSPNARAPGAYRLKLVPKLNVVDTEQAETTNFFSLVDFGEGRPVRQRQVTEFNSVNAEMSRRDREQLGAFSVRPFNVISSNMTSNASHLRMQISPGLAYVDGHRVEQLNPFTVPVRKGTNTVERKGVAVSANIGNYWLVNFVQGGAPVNRIIEVQLFDSPKTSYTSSSVGTQVGTALVHNIQYDQGLIGTSEATYRLYVLSVSLNPGRTLADCKSFHFSSAGDLLTGNIANADGVLIDSGLRTAVFPVGHNAIRSLRDMDNDNNTSFQYTVADTSVSVATNGVLQKNLTGNDSLPYSGTLTTSQEREVILVPRASANGAVAAGTISTTSGSPTITGSGTTFVSSYNRGDFVYLSNGNVFQIQSIANNTSMTSTQNIASTASGLTHGIHFPANVPVSFDRASRTISSTGNQLTINLGTTLSNSIASTLVHQIRRTPANQLIKNLVTGAKVRISTATAGVNGRYCLGLPDVLRITSITRTTNADYTTNAVDVTSHFNLVTNQRDNYYGLSFIERKPGSSLTIGATDFLVVTFDVFTSSNTGGGIGFYSIDSYPIDDSGSPAPNTIRTELLPKFTSPFSGISFDLRDCIDFRPQVVNTATVTTVLNNSTVNPSSVETFDSQSKNIITPNSTFVADLVHYLGRIDKITLNSLGQYNVVEGVASTNPFPPADVSGSMTVAVVKVPPFPSLSGVAAVNSRRPEYAVTVSSTQHKGYTMRDIGRLDRRLSNVEYYTALSLLETQTKDLVIPSSVDPALNRFKNGIFVDSFSSFAASSVTDPEYSAAIDESASRLVPKFESRNLHLRLLSSTSLSNKELVTLSYTHQSIINQPYASRVRNCVENYWMFKGTMEVNPPYDNFVDVNRSPQPAIIEDDNATAALALIENINNRFVNRNDTRTEISTTDVQRLDTTSQTDWLGNVTVSDNFQETVTTTTTSSREILVGSVNTSTQQVGDFVTDVRFIPFIREQVVRISCFGLKPGSTMYCYFDGTAVTNRTAQTNSSFVSRGTSSLVVDPDGTLYFTLNIEGGRYFVGDREIKVLDVNSLASESSATTSANFVFRAFNHSVSKTDLVLSTRQPQIETATAQQVQVTTTRNTFQRSTVIPAPPPPPPPPVVVPDVVPWEPNIPLPDFVEIDFDFNTPIFRGWRVDPIAQTFYIHPQSCEGQEGIFLSKVHLFFQRKDPTFGLNIQIRTTENGYPSSTIVPFSTKRLSSSQVNVSSNASVATVVEFDNPVFLKAGLEYAVVVIPEANSPEYLIYTSKVGDADLTNPNIVVRSDWGDGMLFTSTNNSAWTAIQNEDMKIELFCANFTSTEGTATFATNNLEFLSCSEIQGSLAVGQRVIRFNQTPTTGTVSTIANGTAINGSGTSFLTQYAVGQPIAIGTSGVANSASQHFVRTVTSISNNTHLNVDTPISFGGSGLVSFTGASGIINAINRATGKITLVESNATNATRFTNNSIIVTNSGYANISTVDNQNIDYFQPLISRTNVTNTGVRMRVQMRDSTGVLRNPVDVQFNDTTFNPDFQPTLFSRSNAVGQNIDPVGLTATMTLTSSSRYVSPTLDTTALSLLCYSNVINDNASNEQTAAGAALTKYVSKTVTLGSGQDAEDLRVLLTAHRPPGTDIKVYARVLNDQDNTPFKDRQWTELVLDGAPVVADPRNRNSVAEYQYVLPQRLIGTAVAGTISTTNGNSTISGNGTTFTSLSVGQLVEVAGIAANNRHVAKIASITNNTTLTLDSAVPFSSTGSALTLSTHNDIAFKNPANDGIATYYSQGSRFETFKQFAIKIVLLASQTSTVPHVNDVRAIAMSV